mgnify:CR=1 FL=1
MAKYRNAVIGILLLGVAYLLPHVQNVLSVGSGFAAKASCSAVYVQHRPLAQVRSEELGYFPLSLITSSLIEHNGYKGAAGSAFGLVTRIALFDPRRRSCTLISPEGLQLARGCWYYCSTHAFAQVRRAWFSWSSSRRCCRARSRRCRIQA